MRNFILLLVLILPPFIQTIYANELTHKTTAKPILTVGYTSFNWAPLAFKNDDKIIGLLPALMDAIAEKAGYQIRNVPFSNFNKMVSAFKRNEIDLLIGVSATFDRQKYMIFSDPILSTSFAMLSRSSQHTKITDLSNVIISVENGFAIEEKIIDLQVKGQIIPMPSSTVALSAVNSGLADVYIGNGLSLQNLHTFGSLQQSLYFTPLTELPFERLYITATKNNQDIINKINKAYAQLPQTLLTDIYDNWLTNTQKKMLSNPHTLHLTTAEDLYLQKNKNIRVGYQFPQTTSLIKNDIVLKQLKHTLEHIKNKLDSTITIVPILN